MVDDLELVRMVFEVDPMPEGSSGRIAIQRRLFEEIAASGSAEPVALPTGLKSYSRRSRRRRLGVVVGASIGIIAAGGGIAAATGVLPLPWADQKAGVSFINSSDPASVPGSKVQATLLGPESTVWTVVTDVVDNGPTNFETCSAMSIRGPQGKAVLGDAGFGGCSFGSAVPGGTVSASQEHQISPSISITSWKAPSGATFAIVSGQTPPGYAKVSLGNNRGATATTEPVTNNYYLAYVPWTSLPSHSNLTFYDADGRILSTQDIER
jgi:hypothetical protein